MPSLKAYCFLVWVYVLLELATDECDLLAGSELSGSSISLNEYDSVWQVNSRHHGVCPKIPEKGGGHKKDPYTSTRGGKRTSKSHKWTTLVEEVARAARVAEAAVDEEGEEPVTEVLL
eukprot:gene1856-biopygen1731